MAEMQEGYGNLHPVNRASFQDAVIIEDPRTLKGEEPFAHLPPLRSFRGNYGIPRRRGDHAVKGFFSADEETLWKLKSLHDDYVKELSKYMPVLPTESVIEGNLFYIIQPFVEKVSGRTRLDQTFEEYLEVKNAYSNYKERYYWKILDRMLNFIVRSPKTVGIDGKPENWIEYDYKWHFLDTFPPLLIDDSNTFGEIFNLRDFERKFARSPNHSFFRDTKKIARRFWLKCEQVCPGLDYWEETWNAMQILDGNMEPIVSLDFLEKMKP